MFKIRCLAGLRARVGLFVFVFERKYYNASYVNPRGLSPSMPPMAGATGASAFTPFRPAVASPPFAWDGGRVGKQNPKFLHGSRGARDVLVRKYHAPNALGWAWVGGLGGHARSGLAGVRSQRRAVKGCEQRYPCWLKFVLESPKPWLFLPRPI